MAQKSAKRKLNNPDKKIGKVYSPTEVGVMLKSINGNFTRIDGTIAQINGNINRLIDGYLKLDQKIDKLDEKLSGKIDALDERMCSIERRMNSLENRMNSLEKRMDSMENRMDSMEQEMKSGFGTIVDFMDAIDAESAEIKKKLATKVNNNEYIIIEQRVSKLEFQVNDCQKIIDAAKKP